MMFLSLCFIVAELAIACLEDSGEEDEDSDEEKMDVCRINSVDDSDMHHESHDLDVREASGGDKKRLEEEL